MVEDLVSSVSGVDGVLHSVNVVEERRLITEPSTLRPHSVTVTKTIQVQGVEGTTEVSQQRVDRREVRYRWQPQP